MPGPVPGFHCTFWLHPVTWDLLSFLFDREETKAQGVARKAELPVVLRTTVPPASR